jgi:hypothetical protein
MAAYGISCFGKNDYAHISIKVDFIFLVPMNVNSTTSTDVEGQGVHVAVHTEGDIYFTVTCLLQGQEAKILLVGDLDTVVSILMNSALQCTLTGGGDIL